MSPQAAIVVTGASTGIGYATALFLAEHGFKVFATVLKLADGTSLQEHPSGNIVPIILDVTKPETIKDAFAHIAEQTQESGLAGLVNNAGIALGAPLEFLDPADLLRQFDVNVFGLVAVTQAAMPLLRKATGRIVHIGSVGGLVSLPFLGPYCASKFALEAITNSMRMELLPFGIHCSLVQPGRISTEIWDSGLVETKRVRESLSPQAIEWYGPSLNSIESMLGKAKKAGIEPVRIAQVVHHALTAKRPKVRYLVGIDARVQVIAQALLPTRVFDTIVVFLLKRGWL